MKSAGGAASLAHPGTLLLDAGRAARAGRVAGAGRPRRDRGATAATRRSPSRRDTPRWRREHGLLATGGSDYHGPALEDRGRVLGSCGEPGPDPAALTGLLAGPRSRRRARSQPPASLTVWPCERRRSATFSRWSPWISTASPFTAPPEPHSFLRSLAVGLQQAAARDRGRRSRPCRRDRPSRGRCARCRRPRARPAAGAARRCGAGRRPRWSRQVGCSTRYGW